MLGLHSPFFPEPRPFSHINNITNTKFFAASSFLRFLLTCVNDFATFSDFPAEIRAPAGSEFGVSSYQINLGSAKIMTSGDSPSVLVAFNPAALKVNLPLLNSGAIIIINTGAFTKRNLAKAKFDKDPRLTSALSSFQLVELDIDKLTSESVLRFGLSKSKASRCKNFLALGLILWVFGHDIEKTISWINKLFIDKDTIESNKTALKAGYFFGETNEVSTTLPKYFFPLSRLYFLQGLK